MDIALMLAVDNYQYTGSVSGNTQEEYQNIIWYDDRQKPTWQDLQAYWANYYLPIKRQEVLDSIDKKTEQLIQENFTFNGHIFGMSLQEQMQYTTVSVLFARSKTETDVVYPVVGVPIKTRDNGYYMLKADKCNDFFSLIFNGSLQTQMIGLNERDKVTKMKTLKELEDYIDPRG